MNPELVANIVVLFHGGASVRRIALSLGVSRRTVHRALGQVEQARAGVPPERAPQRAAARGSKLDPYEAAVADLLARYPDISVRRILEELRALGYTGGYTILSERVLHLRPSPVVAPVQRFETGPGAQAQMDFSTYDLDFSDEGRRRVHAFSYVLGYSRRQYLRFVEAQDFATTVREHIRAFEHLGGVAATCLYDNMKVVVSGHDGDEPVYNPRFLAFAAHYGFRPIACRVRRPQTKGKVERPFGYIESNLLGGRTFRSLEHLNETAAWWLAEVADVRIHGQTKARPLDRHAEELPHLIPLPARPFDAAEVVYRTVDAEGFVVYRQNFYAVPWRLIGQTVAVRVTEHELVIHDSAFVETVRHRLFPRTTVGGRSPCAGHEPPRDAQQRSEHLSQRFAQFGAAGTRFLEGLLGSSRFGKNQAERVLSLAAAYPRADVLQALERAVQYGAFSLQAIVRILAARGRPKTPLDALADDHRSYLDRVLEGTPTPPRPITDYQALLGESPHNGEATDRERQAGHETENPDDGQAEPA
ncbi:MAG: IS21 family transposase [Isosphaeraceae bacterium]|nr:IS21 family transposase [Isosphaeraceae bacterium]